MTKAKKLIEQIRNANKRKVTTQDATNLIELTILSIDLFQVRLEQGAKIAYQDDLWYLFDVEGEEIVSGESVRSMLINLVWVD